MPGKATVGALAGVLSLESAEFEKGVQSARASWRRFSGELQDVKFTKGVKAGLRELEAGFKASAANAGTFGSVLSSMGVAGVGAAAALGGLALALGRARQALAFGDEIGDAAAKLAVSTDALQEYRYAIHQLGGEYKDADTALENFSKTFGAAKSGLSAKAAKPFEALGLDLKTLGTTEDALHRVIEAISQLSDPSEQAAVAEKLGLTSILPAARAGTAEIDRLRKAAHDLGYVMDADLIAKAGTANDRLEDLQAIVGVQLNSAFVDLAPLVLAVADALAESASVANQLAGAIGDVAAWAESSQLLKLAKILGGIANRAVNPVAAVTGLASDAAGLLNPRGGSTRIDRAAVLALAAPPTAAGGGNRLKNLLGETVAERALAAASSKRAAEQKQAAEAAERLRKSDQDFLDNLIEERLQLGKTSGQVRLMEADKRAAAATTNDMADAIRDAAAALELERQNIEVLRKYVDPTADQVRLLADEFARLRELLPAGEAHKYFQAVNDKIEVRVAPTVSDEDVAAFQDRFKDAFVLPREEFAKDFGQAFADGVEAAMDGDLGGFLKSSFRSILNGALSSAGTSLGRLIAGSPTGGGDRGLSVLGAGLGLGGSIATGIGVAGSGATTAALAGTAGTVGGGALAGIGAALASNPVGWGIAAIGLIGAGLGIFGGGGKKKRAAQQEAAQRAQQQAEAEAQRLADIAREKRSAEIALMRAQGDEAAALAAERADELAAANALDPALAELKQKLFDAEDAATAAAKALEVAATARGIEIETLEVQGKGAEARALRREDELAALAKLDPSLAKLKQTFYDAQDAADAAAKAVEAQAKAAEDAAAALAVNQNAYAQAGQRVAEAQAVVQQAYDREREALEGRAAQMRGFAESLRGYTKAMAGDAASAESAFRKAAAGVALGDIKAYEAFGGAADAFLDGAAKSARSMVDLQRAQAQVRNAAERGADTADRQATIAEQQLAELKAAVAGWITLDDTTRTGLQSVHDAIGALAAAFGVQGRLQGGAMDPRWGAPQNTEVNKALAQATGYTGAFGSGGFQAFITGAQPWQQAAARDILNAYGETDRIVGFASGGSAKVVGGMPGIDRLLTRMRVTQGEFVSVSHLDPVSTVASMDARLGRLEDRTLANVLSLNKVARALDRATKFGLPVRAVDPSANIKVEVA